MEKKQIINNGKKLGKDLYQTTSKVGRISSILTLIVSIFIGLALIISGIVLLSQKPIVTTDDNFPDDNFQNNAKTSSNIGAGFLIGFGILIILFGVINYYLVKKYKPIAALEGGKTILNFFR